METKLWVAFCALLLFNLGSTEQDAPGHEPVEAVPSSALEPISHAATAPSPNGTDTNPDSVGSSSSSNGTSTKGEVTSLTPVAKQDNDTIILTPPEATTPEKNINVTDPSISQPPSGSHAPDSPIVLTSTAGPADTPTTTPLANTSQLDKIPPPDSNSSTSVPHATTTEPPKAETTTTTAATTATTTTTIAQSSSTSSASSSQEPNSVSPTLTSPQNTSNGHPETTITPPSSPTAQAKADTPSQLNVGGDTTMVHEAPTLDPLLAGLVSAFIITAVIITLLLFLKLRRRDNRPEFRRLQDLPMDDMMEDTPLSMYSY